MLKTPHFQRTCGSWYSWKAHAAVARGAFASQNLRSQKQLSFGEILAVYFFKRCTPLWREARFEFKTYGTLPLRTAFTSRAVQKAHFVLVRGTSRSQKRKPHRAPVTFGSWDVEKVHALAAGSTCRSQMCKTHRLRSAFGSWDVELRREARLEVKNGQKHTRSDHFGRWAVDK